MDYSLAELFMNWDVPWMATLALLVVAALYAIGWIRARKTRPDQLTVLAPCCVSFRDSLHFRGHCFSARYVERVLTVHAYGAALCADVHCAAPDCSRRTCSAVASRLAAFRDPHLFASAVRIGDSSFPVSDNHAPPNLLDGDERGICGMAYSGGL